MPSATLSILVLHLTTPQGREPDTRGKSRHGVGARMVALDLARDIAAIS